MSYIIAFVSFPPSKKLYPVSCFIDDLKSGEAVYVRMHSPEGRMKRALVDGVEYLNWDCTNILYCRATDVRIHPNGFAEFPPQVVRSSFSSIEELIDQLALTSWVARKPTSHTYRAIFSLENSTERANFFIRKNGIDIQLLPHDRSDPLKYGAPLGFSPSAGRVWRNTLSHNGLNALKQMAQFADAFRDNDMEYMRLISFEGRSKGDDRRLPKKETSFEKDLYEALGGRGDSVYVGDGLYLSPSGWHD